MTAQPASSPSLRLFTALWPPPAVREALLALRDRWQWPAGAALVAAPKLHVTLHFLGPVPQAQVPALLDALAQPLPPTELRADLQRQRVWPGGIAVLELQVPDALRRLHALMGEALRRLGLPVEARPWRPHVTFARKASGAVAPHEEHPLPPWPIDEYALVRSSGGRYDVLHRYPAVKG